MDATRVTELLDEAVKKPLDKTEALAIARGLKRSTDPALIQKDAPRRKDKYVSVILANLTVKEDARFHRAKVLYSGSTGPGASPESYGGYAPYIATSTSQMGAAIKALRWRRFTVTANAHQWIVIKCAPKKRLAIDACKAHGWS